MFFITDGVGGSELIEQTTSLMVTEGMWSPPSDWSGPSAALYRSFDSSDGLVLIEASVLLSNVPLVTGKVNLLVIVCRFIKIALLLDNR